MDQYIQLNFAIIPSTEMALEAIEMSRSLSQIGAQDFALDGVSYIPHITLFAAEYPLKNEALIYERASATAQSIRRFECKFSGVSFSGEYLFIDFDRTDELYNLHLSALENLHPLREGHLREKYRIQLEDKNFAESVQGKLLAEFGSSLVKCFYHPHLTLTTFKENSKAEAAAKIIHWRNNRIEITEVGLFTMGEKGTCRTLHSKFPLNAS
jgi:2'-5' RNA ligase